MSDDLSGVNIGDEVAIWSGGFRRSATIARIAKVTPTQVVVAGQRYQRRSGRRVGGYGIGYISLVTEEIRGEIAEAERRRSAMNTVADIRWHALSTDVLEAIARAYITATHAEEPNQ